MQQGRQSNNPSHIIDNAKTDYSLTHNASSRPRGPGGKEILRATARSNHASAHHSPARPTPPAVRASPDMLKNIRSGRPSRTRSTLAAGISASPSASAEPSATPLPRSVRDAHQQKSNGISFLPSITSTTGSSARTVAELLREPKLLRPGPPTLHHGCKDSKYKLQQVKYAASADPRGYTPIWEYALPDGKAVIMIDADDSYVHFTGIWRAAGFGRRA